MTSKPTMAAAKSAAISRTRTSSPLEKLSASRLNEFIPPTELSESLRPWLKTDRPVLIEVVTRREEEPSPWPFLLKW